MTEVQRYDFRSEVIDLVPALRAYARKLCRNISDREDLVQETICKAFANSHRFEPGTKLKSWLFHMQFNIFCTYYQKAKQTPCSIEDVVSLTPCVLPSQEWVLRGKEVEIALHSLPAHYRDAIIDIVLDGRSYEDTAAQHHCPVGTVKSRVNRAKERLAALLGDSVKEAAHC